jgi:hypothetical protein
VCSEVIEPKTMTVDDGDEVGVFVYEGGKYCIILWDVTRVEMSIQPSEQSRTGHSISAGS